MSIKVFSGNRMIDTKEGKVIEKDISILVKDSEIISVDSSEKISSHEMFQNAEKIKLNGTILPGLVDCHVHLIGFGDGTPGDVLVKTDDNLLAIKFISLNNSCSLKLLLIKPIDFALSALIKSPVKSISMACLFLTTLDKATIGVEQNNPILTPGVANVEILLA